MYNFKDKTVLITGGSRGIGEAMCSVFAGLGANVIFTYLQSDREAEHLREVISQKGVICKAVKCDVSKEADVINLMQIISADFAKIDFIINNAGVVSEKELLDKDYSDWITGLSVNLIGQHLCIKHVNEFLSDNSRIVNISSTSAVYDFDPKIAEYDSAKAGVIALTKNYAKLLAPKTLVNCIAPGWIDTDINNDVSKENLNLEIKKSYLKRIGSPIEIANVAAFLCSDNATYITGAVIVVDGGHD